MALTRTINYTQNVPVSLAFGTTYLTPTPSRAVQLIIDSTPAAARMGGFLYTETAGVSVIKTGQITVNGFLKTIFEGDVVAINSIMNTIQFKNEFYNCENTQQTLTTANRTVTAPGEIQIQIPAGTSHGLSVGSTFKIDSTDFQVTAIDSVLNPIRIWGIASTRTTVDITSFSGKKLKNSAGVDISILIDMVYNNPHGDFSVSATIKEAGVTTETGTISFAGVFFVDEPTFVVDPPTSITLGTAGTYYDINWCEIDQTDDNYQSVQILTKALTNDPQFLGVAAYTALPGYPSGGTTDAQLQFIGDAIEAKLALGLGVGQNGRMNFSATQVGQRISSVSTSNFIQWMFYGTVTECNLALANLQYAVVAPTGDFGVETRIVNGRSRIYRTRGN